MQAQAGQRPLLGAGEDWPARLSALLEKRGAHYASFPLIVAAGGAPVEDVAWKTQVKLGAYHVRGMSGLNSAGGYDVRVAPGGRAHAGV